MASIFLGVFALLFLLSASLRVALAQAGDAQLDPPITEWVTSPIALMLVGVVAAICEGFKRMGFPKNATWIIALVVGLLGATFYSLVMHQDTIYGDNFGQILFKGVLVGLGGSGLWSVTKSLFKVGTGEENWTGEPKVERRAERVVDSSREDSLLADPINPERVATRVEHDSSLDGDFDDSEPSAAPVIAPRRRVRRVVQAPRVPLDE